MENNDAKYISYLILQKLYLDKMGLKDKTEEEILKEMPKYFPDNWTMLDLDTQIKYITQAVNKKQNLKDFVDEEIIVIK